MILPELRLSPSDPIDKNILSIPQCQRDRSSSLITSISILIIPLLPIPKEERFPMPSYRKRVPADPPSSGALCVRDPDTVPQPVLDVVVPCEFSLDGDIAVLQILHIHDLGDGVISFHNLDLPVFAALLECVHNKGAVIFASAGSYGAKTARLVHAGQSSRHDKEQKELDSISD